MPTYIKLFVDYLDAIEPLGDAERGRLFTSLLEYARDGAAPQLCGNERFLFPMMKSQIDRDNKALQELPETRSQAGKMGGRPKKQAKPKKANGFCESKKSYDKGNDKEKDKDNPLKGGDARARFTPPTLAEVQSYVAERHSPVDPQEFIDFYASKGWMVGKTPMKDWKAACRNAEKWDRWGRNYGQRGGNVFLEMLEGE